MVHVLWLSLGRNDNEDHKGTHADNKTGHMQQGINVLAF